MQDAWGPSLPFKLKLVIAFIPGKLQFFPLLVSSSPGPQLLSGLHDLSCVDLCLIGTPLQSLGIAQALQSHDKYTLSTFCVAHAVIGTGFIARNRAGGKTLFSGNETLMGVKDERSSSSSSSLLSRLHQVVPSSIGENKAEGRRWSRNRVVVVDVTEKTTLEQSPEEARLCLRAVWRRREGRLGKLGDWHVPGEPLSYSSSHSTRCLFPWTKVSITMFIAPKEVNNLKFNIAQAVEKEKLLPTVLLQWRIFENIQKYRIVRKLKK